MLNSQEKSKISIRLPKLGQTRGQISETVTWVVATVAIIVVLILSILVVQFHFKNKKFENTKGDSDLLVIKSMTGYLKTGNAFNELKNEGNFDSVNGDLAKNIFENALKLKSLGGFFWVGIFEKGYWIENNYFKDTPHYNLPVIIRGEIKLDNEKSLNIVEF